MFSNNWIGVHETADDVWKDLVVNNRWAQVLHKQLNLQHKYNAQ